MTSENRNATDVAKMIEALNQFGEAYVNLRDEWLRTNTCDLNDTTAIKHYPFNMSFDELNVLDWVMETISELQSKPTLVEMYVESNDITFIMEEISVEGEVQSSECVGWYHGKPNPEDTAKYSDRKHLKAIY